MNFIPDNSSKTAFAVFNNRSISAIPIKNHDIVEIDPNLKINVQKENIGKYSVFKIANWFLSKENMTHKKLQKLCYYAQAWFYALHGERLEDTDFQAWVHGPVSPVLYDRFKVFGSDTIRIKGNYTPKLEAEIVSFLEDIWDTYGDNSGNSLEMLTHRELPWIEARNGYLPNERCSVVISPETMARYYKSIYAGE